MALKDWVNTFRSEYSIIWENEKKNKILEVQYNFHNEWSMWVGKEQIGKTDTKTKIIKRANAYMRIH